MIIHDIPGVGRCHWEEDVSAIRIEWFSLYCDGDEATVIIQKGLDFLRARGGGLFWIADMSRARGAFKPSDQEWIAAVPGQFMAKLGVKYLVTVVSRSAVTELANKRWQSSVAPNGFEMLNVATLQEAKQWLQSKGKRKP